MEISRKEKSIQNASIAIAMQLVNVIVGLVSRTIFIKLLGNDYLSVNGLFTNILTLLSFAELGIGNAIIFALYKPVAHNDEEKVCEILNLYRKAFRIIAITIIALGICVIPFLNYLVHDVPDITESITLIYIIFVISTASTYLFSYKNAIIIAYQQNYIIALVKESVNIVRVVTQVVFLLITHNYIGYLLIEILFCIVNNLICNFYADYKFPYIKKYKNSKLPENEQKRIFTDVKSLFVYKAGSAVLNGTDNIIISSLLLTSYVGVCSNYTLVINTISGLLMQACSSITASIGNHNALSTGKEMEKKFKELNSLCYMIFAFAAVCLSVLLNELILVWLGSKYLIDQKIVIALVSTFLLTGMNQIVSTYRMTLGLFRQAKMVPFTAAVINIVLSIILGMKMGLFGVFIATSISKILTFSAIDPILIYKRGFGMSSRNYYMVFCVRIIGVCLLYLITNQIVHMIALEGVMGLIIKTCTCGLVSFGLLFSFMLFDKDFRDICEDLKNLIKKKIIKK